MGLGTFPDEHLPTTPSVGGRGGPRGKVWSGGGLKESLELNLLGVVKGGRGGGYLTTIPELTCGPLLRGYRWDNLLGLGGGGGDVEEVLGGGIGGCPNSTYGRLQSSIPESLGALCPGGRRVVQRPLWV